MSSGWARNTYDEHPNADRFEVANAVGRNLTDEEQLAVNQFAGEVVGALAY
jgi:hypothetical protein